MRDETRSTWSDDLHAAFDTLRILRRFPDRSWRTIVTMPGPTLRQAGGARFVVDCLRFQLERLPPSLFASQHWLAQVPPMGPQGFGIDIYRISDGIAGYFGGLEMHFDTLDEALVWVERAVSARYQLRTLLIGSRPIEWRLEPVEDPGSTMVLAAGVGSVMRYFRKTTETIRSNELDR